MKAAFAGALHFNEVSLIVHDKIHVHLGMAVLLIAQVQAGRIVHEAAGDGGHLVPDGADEQTLVLDQLVHRAHQRHKSTGDGCRAGSAISFQYVAVQGDGPFAQLGHIHRLAQGTAD